MSDVAHVDLPPRLDLSSAGDVAAAIQAVLGQDAVVDLANVTQIGTPGLQVLLSAHKSWAASGHALTLANVGPTHESQLAQFGLALADLHVASHTTGPEAPAADAASEPETVAGG